MTPFFETACETQPKYYPSHFEHAKTKITMEFRKKCVFDILIVVYIYISYSSFCDYTLMCEFDLSLHHHHSQPQKFTIQLGSLSLADNQERERYAETLPQENVTTENVVASPM